MKLSEKIEELQKALAEYGDIDVIYSKDDEGNEFSQCGHGGILYAESRRGKLPQRNIEVYVEIDEDCDDMIVVYCIN